MYKTDNFLLAAFLEFKGFDCLRMEADGPSGKFIVPVFDDSTALRDAVEQFWKEPQEVCLGRLYMESRMFVERAKNARV